MQKTLSPIVVSLGLMTAIEARADSQWSLATSGTQFETVTERDTFVDLVTGNTLKRFGINLEVQPDGSIEGRAFGVKVRGAWEWRDRYFCRNLRWGSTEIGTNCQEVKVSGDLVRFTSDRGTGEFADLQLR